MQYGKTKDDAYHEAFRYSWRYPSRSWRHFWYIVLSVVGSLVLKVGWALRYRASRVFEQLVNEFEWNDGAEST